MTPFRPDARLARVEGLLATDLDQETVLMSIAAGAYYGLGGVARRIWELLAVPCSHQDLVAQLVAEFEVSPERCAQDVEGFLEALQREGLLQVDPQ